MQKTTTWCQRTSTRARRVIERVSTRPTRRAPTSAQPSSAPIQHHILPSLLMIDVTPKEAHRFAQTGAQGDRRRGCSGEDNEQRAQNATDTDRWDGQEVFDESSA